MSHACHGKQKRKDDKGDLIGPSRELPVAEWPYRQLLAKVKLVKQRSVKKITNREVAQKVAVEIKHLYAKANAKFLEIIISDLGMIQKIETQKRIKYELRNKKGTRIKARRVDFKANLDRLFNILQCQVEVLKVLFIGLTGMHMRTPAFV